VAVAATFSSAGIHAKTKGHALERKAVDGRADDLAAIRRGVFDATVFRLGSSLMQATLMMTARRETVANQQADSCP
jgi:hypothetical protein